MNKNSYLVFGAAYYAEYAPEDRLEKDMKLMAGAGMNTIRIAESTWSVHEPVNGEIDFGHVQRVIEAAAEYGINVIIGTPTYAVPKWLMDLDPGVLSGNKFGPRQNMDITDPTYRMYAERIIRGLLSATASYPNVIGFQIDNETKHYNVHNERVVSGFREWLRKRFDNDIEAVNSAYMLRHWSGSVSSFDELPDPEGTVHGGYACAFEEYRRELAADFLMWQSEIVREYKRDDQFITHNMDYDWVQTGSSLEQCGYSAGLQPGLNDFEAAKALTLIGTDIYCPTADKLTGWQIAYGGDLMRSLRPGAGEAESGEASGCAKADCTETSANTSENKSGRPRAMSPYIILESQSQAFTGWLPYPGQLRLMALSHLASGANGLMYWPWASIHGGIEAYWKGILDHDGEPGRTYEEIAEIGDMFKKLSAAIAGNDKLQSRIAMIVSPEAMFALKWFPTAKDVSYNDIVNLFHRTLYELGLECDILYDREEGWSGYDMLVIPGLYCVSDEFTGRVRKFVRDGGTVLAGPRSFFADENAKIHHDRQPHGLTDVFGVHYQQMTRGSKYLWMELLESEGAEIIERYDDPHWGEFAVFTHNKYGKGHAWYLGGLPVKAGEEDCERGSNDRGIRKLKEYILKAVSAAGIEEPEYRWPVILKRRGNLIFFLNYSDESRTVNAPCACKDILTGAYHEKGENVELGAWGASVLSRQH